MSAVIQPLRIFAKKQAQVNGEKILREVQNEFGRPHSSTYMSMKVLNHKGQDRFEKIIPTLIQKSQDYFDEVYHMYPNMKHTVLQQLPRPMGKNMAGDCGECAAVVQHKFMCEKIPAVNFIVEILDKNADQFANVRANHMFTVTNMGKNASFSDPSTWGKEAVITDLWSGITAKVSDALEYYRQIFKFNPETEKLNFKIENEFNEQIYKALMGK